MNLKALVASIDETQDGRPLSKYVLGGALDGLIAWAKFKDIEELSMTDALNILLLKIADSEDRESDIGYVIQQLERARPVIEDSVEVQGVERGDLRPLKGTLLNRMSREIGLREERGA